MIWPKLSAAEGKTQRDRLVANVAAALADTFRDVKRELRLRGLMSTFFPMSCAILFPERGKYDGMELHPMQQPMPAGNGGLCLCVCEGFLPHAVS